MPDDVFNVVKTVVEVIVLPAAAYVGKQFNDRVNDIKQRSDETSEQLTHMRYIIDEHKLDCEKTYATKLDTNAALNSINAMFLEIRNDIKQLWNKR